MQCPYCTTEINDAAHVCPQCTRDLYLFKPLLEKISALEEKIVEQEALQAQVVGLEAALAEASKAPLPAASVGALPWLASVLLLWVLPLGLLLLAHVLLTIVYDANTLYLRIISLLIPLPFGMLLMRQQGRAFLPWLIAAFGLAIAAVLGMSWIIGVVDKTPVLPADLREWKEFFEYVASIGFSYATGMWLARMWRARKAGGASPMMLKLAQVGGKHKGSAEKVQAIAQKLSDIGGTLIAVGTTIISIYTGLKDFLGGG